MAKIKVIGDVVQIKSDLTEDDFKKISNYAPEALKILDDKGNEVFGISMGDAHWSKYGVAFCNTDSNGKLFMTTNNPVTDHKDPSAEKELITEIFAQVLFHLGVIEQNFQTLKTELTAIEQEAARSITLDEECTCEAEASEPR